MTGTAAAQAATGSQRDGQDAIRAVEERAVVEIKDDYSAERVVVAAVAEAAIRRQGLDGITLPGHRLREMRAKYRVKRSELGEKIGTSASTIWDWETGRHNVPPSLYLPILEFFHEKRAERERWRALYAGL